jgi:enediyne biosynthesis protein E4
MRSSPHALSAALAVALFHGAVVAQSPLWTDVAASSGVVVPPGAGHALARGAVCADMNGDALVDFIVPGAWGAPYRAYLNMGGWFFLDVSPVLGLGPSDEAKMISPVDYDNDGDLDLFICVRGSPSRLLQNDGMMIFTDVSSASGLDFTAEAFHATWGDYDRDGFVDLYVGSRPIPGTPAANHLFHNEGDGTFVDVTADAGVSHDSLTFAAMWFDYDTDGWPDLFVTSDLEFFHPSVGNAVYRNNQDGTFTDVGAQLGWSQRMQAMGIDVADINRDGRPCFFVSNTATSMGDQFGNPTVDGHVMTLWNPLSQSFDRVEQAYGTRVDNVGWANFFFDYDNDGRDDLFVQHMGSPCALFKNSPTLPWPNVGAAAGFNQSLLECAAGYADFDNDGCMDILQPWNTTPLCIMKNPGGTTNRWLNVKLVGTTSNRNGFGARIRAATVSDGVVRTSWMRSGNGFLVGNEPIVHFGLGPNLAVDLLEITWPSGTVQTIPNVSSNQRLVVVEPEVTVAGPQSSGTRNWMLSSPDDSSRIYVTALAFSTGPGIVVGSRTVPLAADPLFELSLTPGNPFVTNNVGVLNILGQAAGTFWAPPIPELAGFVVYTASVTLEVTPVFELKSVIGPCAITL